MLLKNVLFLLYTKIWYKFEINCWVGYLKPFKS